MPFIKIVYKTIIEQSVIYNIRGLLLNKIAILTSLIKFESDLRGTFKVKTK